MVRDVDYQPGVVAGAVPDMDAERQPSPHAKAKLGGSLERAGACELTECPEPGNVRDLAPGPGNPAAALSATVISSCARPRSGTSLPLPCAWTARTYRTW